MDIEKKCTTSERLKSIMNEQNLKQVDILKKALPFSKMYNIKLNKNDLSQYLSGKTEPGQKKIMILSEALDVAPAWLMGFDVPKKKENIDDQLFNIIEENRDILTTDDYEMIIDYTKMIVEKRTKKIKGKI